jgi:hypothetical protein
MTQIDADERSPSFSSASICVICGSSLYGSEENSDVQKPNTMFKNRASKTQNEASMIQNEASMV